MINDKEKALVNLKKAKRLISKIMKMIEEDQYCIDIMQQNLAVMGMLKSSHEKLMKNHLNTCFRQAMETDDEEKKQKMIEEITKVMRFLNK
jgi:DNA-binding FrmR family transcriptional regulator